MSMLVFNALFDADACEIMGNTIFSTNPREVVTLEQIQMIMDRNINNENLQNFYH